MTVDINTLVEWLSSLVWALIRITGFVMTVPIFGNKLVSSRIKLGLSLAIAVVIAPFLEDVPSLLTLNFSMLTSVFSQLLAGIGLGFATMVFFQLFVVAGQFIGMQMGLGFAAMVDPGNGLSVTVWSQFFLMLATLTFLMLGGHLVLLEVLLEGFKSYPAGTAISTENFLWEIISLGHWMFLGGALVALPAVIALLIVNLAFGVMSRSAPQLNIFSLGFPFSLLFGLVAVWVLISGWSARFETLATDFFVITRFWTG